MLAILKVRVFFVLGFLCFFACNTSTKKDNEPTELSVESNNTYAAFGKEITPEAFVNTSALTEQLQNLSANDTISTKLYATVKEVCQSKGCWMVLDLGSDRDIRVKFKDYAFFMPKDIVGKDVIVNGKAFVEELSVEDQKHLAEDGGASADEISAITESQQTFAFLADGVLLVESEMK